LFAESINVNSSENQYGEKSRRGGEKQQNKRQRKNETMAKKNAAKSA